MKIFQNWIAVLAVVSGVIAPVQNVFAWGRFDGGDHPAYNKRYVRERPVVVHKTYVEHAHDGCVGCGVGIAAVAGLVGGAIIGAAIAGNSAAAPPPEVVQAPPPQVVVVQAPAAPQGLPIGSEVAALPPGCANMNVNGVTLYQCGPNWFQPFFGGNGVYYTVVQAP